MNKMTHHSGYGVLTYNQSGVPEVGQLTSSHIQANTVTESLINNNAVTTDKINNSAVTEAKIGTGAVTNGKIGSSAVDTAQLATSAVETVNINAGAVTEAKISDDAVGHEKMKHHTDYGVMKYSSSGVPSVGTITGNHIALGTVTSGNIMNGAVGTTQLADNSVTSAKLSGVSLTVSDDSIDQTKVKFVAGNGSAGGQGDFSAGTTPSFLSYASGDDIQLQGLSFFQGDFDTSTNLDDNNLKMQQVKIKQTFTSENYISSTKTLNQNMDILDQRLGYITQFSGTEGLYMVLASGTYNWNASRNGNGTLQTVTNAVMDLPKVTDGTETNQTWYSVQMASIYKVPDVRQFALYARGQVSSVLNGFKGYARIRVEGDNFSSVNQEGGAYDSTSSALKAVYKDATTLQNYKIYNVWVDIKFNNFGVSGTKNFELGDWCLVAKRQITAVGGETNVADDSPL